MTGQIITNNKLVILAAAFTVHYLILSDTMHHILYTAAAHSTRLNGKRVCIIPALPNLFADCSSNVQGNSQSIRTKKSRLQEYHTLVENDTLIKSLD